MRGKVQVSHHLTESVCDVGYVAQGVARCARCRGCRV